jgi:glycosyltransferase involved in cell wall biosynthesis
MKKIKVLTNRAHCGHQYELWKLPISVDILSKVGDRIENWDYSMRPLPKNANYVHVDQALKNKYDLIILHFDENGLPPRHPHLGNDWGKAFRFLKENFKEIPKISICHGTPQHVHQGDISKEILNVEVYEDRRIQMVEYMKDIMVICNSNQAREEWGFHKSKTIWHGFDPNKFVTGTNRLGILAPKFRSVRSRPHYRGFYIQRDVVNLLPENIKINSTEVEDPVMTQDINIYANNKFNNYINTINKYSVYLNTTWRSPMPRARGEAMMCGLSTVNCINHDADMFIKHGENGFLSNDPEEIKDILVWLMNNPDKSKKLGLNSRETAIKEFNIERFLNDWKNTILEVRGTL